MSAETTVVLEGEGRVTEVPPALRGEGAGYGLDISRAVSVLDETSRRLGGDGFLRYFVDADGIFEEIEHEVGEPESDEDEIRQHELLLELAPYHSIRHALPQLEALLEHVETHEPEVGPQIRAEYRGNYELTLWDLRVIVEILRGASTDDRGFFLWTS